MSAFLSAQLAECKMENEPGALKFWKVFVLTYLLPVFSPKGNKELCFYSKEVRGLRNMGRTFQIFFSFCLSLSFFLIVNIKGEMPTWRQSNRNWSVFYCGMSLITRLSKRAVGEFLHVISHSG